MNWFIVFIWEIMENIARIWRQRFVLLINIVRHLWFISSWMIIWHMMGMLVMSMMTQSKYCLQ